jgi:hypothetical protein
MKVKDVDKSKVETVGPIVKPKQNNAVVAGCWCGVAVASLASGTVSHSSGPCISHILSFPRS